MLCPSAARFAAHWVTDAIAGDESLDFSVIKALVGVSTDSLAGAPEATRERVALRCLQEVVSVATEGGVAEAGAGAGTGTGRMLSVDAPRSCEEVLVELTGQVGSFGTLEKDMFPYFSQDIQKFIHIKLPALPETSFELLREVNLVPPSPVEQNGKNKHGNDQLLCNISHDHVDTVNLRCSADSAQHQQENLTNLVNETDTRNMQNNPIESTPVFHQPCTSYNMGDKHHQENTIGASVRSPEKSPTNDDRNTSAAAEPAKAGCSADLLGSNTKPMSKQDVVDHHTMLQPQSCGDIDPKPPCYNDGDRPHDDSTSILSSKDHIHEEPTLQATIAPDFGRRTDTIPTNTSEIIHLPKFVTGQNTTNIAGPHISTMHMGSPQYDSSQKLSQDPGDCSARVQPLENDSSHDELHLRTAGVVPSVSCNEAIHQGNKSGTNQPQENAKEHSEMFGQQNGDKPHLEVTCTDKVNQSLHDDGKILKTNIVCDGQIALESPYCNMILHNKSLEADSLPVKNTGTNMAGIQKSCIIVSVPNSPRDENEGAKEAPNRNIVGSAMAETSRMHCPDDSSSNLAAARLLSMTGNIPFYSQDKDANGSLEGLSEQDLCVKCGKDGQLLRCSSCLLAAHDSCFGSSVTFDDSGQFYCPVCLYTKATEAYQKAKKAYSEARKNISVFLGTKQFVKQHHEQSTGKQQRAANSEDHLNGCNTSKRQANHQSEADNLSNKDEEPGHQNKKQKINSISDTCPEVVVTEKASLNFNSNGAPMNNDCSLQNKRKQIHIAEHEQQVENAEAREEQGNENSSHGAQPSSHNAEASEEHGNGNSSHGAQPSSHNRCSPVASQTVEAGKDNGRTNSTYSHECENSDEIEATSSNGSGKRSSPPWRNTRQHKAKLQEKDTGVLKKSKKALECQDQDMPSPPKKRNYVYPPKRHSNPLTPAGRRPKLCWQEVEEQALREAMTKFAPKDDEPIPWIQILEYGKDVFDKTRLPSDLRVKWRNLMKKSSSSHSRSHA